MSVDHLGFYTGHRLLRKEGAISDAVFQKIARENAKRLLAL